MRGVAGMDSKPEARAKARAVRRAAPRPDPAGLAAHAIAFLSALDGPLRTTSYVSYGIEPDTGVLNAELEAAGYTVLLPRVCASGPVDLEWLDSRGPREVSAMGIAEPVGPSLDLLPVRAMLIPALAVTVQGDRLGKGGGYYDRVLARLPDSVPVAAIVGDDDVIEELPTEAHDRPVDALITPTRVMWTDRVAPPSAQ